MNGQRKGALLIMSAAFLWGTLGVFAKTIYAVTPVDPISLSLLRLLFAIPVFGLLVGLKGYRLTMTRREVVLFIGFGFFSVAVYVSLYFSSIAYTTVQHAAALLYTAPAFVAVFSWLVLKEQLTRSKIVAVLLSILGAFLILGLASGEPLFASRTQIGDWLAIGGGLAYSTWYIFGKMLGGNREAAVTSFVGLSIGALLLLPLVFMLGGLHLFGDWMES